MSVICCHPFICHREDAGRGDPEFSPRLTRYCIFLLDCFASLAMATTRQQSSRGARPRGDPQIYSLDNQPLPVECNALLRLLRHECHRLKAVDGGDLNIDYMNNMYTAIQSWVASLSCIGTSAVIAWGEAPWRSSLMNKTRKP